MIWEFPKIGVPYFGVLIIRILLCRVLYSGPQFSETPILKSNHSKEPGTQRKTNVVSIEASMLNLKPSRREPEPKLGTLKQPHKPGFCYRIIILKPKP